MLAVNRTSKYASFESVNRPSIAARGASEESHFELSRSKVTPACSDLHSLDSWYREGPHENEESKKRQTRGI